MLPTTDIFVCFGVVFYIFVLFLLTTMGYGRRRLHLNDHGWHGAFGPFTGSFLLRVYLAVFLGRVLIEVSGRIPIERREDMFSCICMPLGRG